MKHLVFAKLYEDAKAPERKHSTDAGADVFSYGFSEVAPHSVSILQTGVTFHVPEGYMLSVRPKSRNNHLIGAGVIDAGYQGEILVKVVNFTDETMLINKGDAIAQIVVVPIETPPLLEMSLGLLNPKESERAGTGGIVAQFNG